MASLLKVGGLILGFAVLLYGAAVLLLLAPMPLERGRLDTGSVFADRWAYRLEERYVAANVWSMDEKRDRVIFLGASAARLTFRPELFQSVLPGGEIDNLSIEGSNISMARKTLHLIYQAMPVGWRGHTVFVLAVSYTNFVENRFAFLGRSDNLTAALRHSGLYREEDGVFDARFSPVVMRAALLLSRPLLAVPYLRQLVTGFVPDGVREKLNLFLGRRAVDDAPTQRLNDLDHQGDAAHDAFVVTPDLRAWLIRGTAVGIGGDHALPDEQFLELEKMAGEIAAHGDRLVVVDLPLPRWHLLGLPEHADSYREKMAATMSRLLARPDISYLDLRRFDDPGNFFDAVHPKPRLMKVLRADVIDSLKGHAGAAAP